MCILIHLNFHQCFFVNRFSLVVMQQRVKKWFLHFHVQYIWADQCVYCVCPLLVGVHDHWSKTSEEAKVWKLALWSLKGIVQLKWVVRQVKWKGLSLLGGKTALASDPLDIGPKNRNVWLGNLDTEWMHGSWRHVALQSKSMYINFFLECHYTDKHEVR